MPLRFESWRRLDLLRARVAEQRAMLQHLQRTFTDASMKGRAERGLVELDVVDAVMVARIHPSMTADEVEALRRDTAATLRSALRTRTALQAAFHKCGADARLAPESVTKWRSRTGVLRLRKRDAARSRN